MMRGEQYPEGVDHLASALIRDGTFEQTKDPRYWLVHVREGTREALWLERVVSPRDAVDTEFVVVDAVDLPVRAKGDEFVYDCRLDENFEPEVVAIVRFDSVPYTRFSSHVLAAWRLERNTERIETIPPDEISCLDPAAGT
ncbi:MAG: hypothetical protein ACRDQ2_05890 [Gaiellales bacterium]